MKCIEEEPHRHIHRNYDGLSDASLGHQQSDGTKISFSDIFYAIMASYLKLIIAKVRVLNKPYLPTITLIHCYIATSM